MSTFYTYFLSKSDFSFILLLVTFEPLEVEQSYIPLLKAPICGINVVGDQGCSCMSTFCHASLKIALLLHKMVNGPYSFSETVYFHMICLFFFKVLNCFQSNPDILQFLCILQVHLVHIQKFHN